MIISIRVGPSTGLWCVWPNPQSCRSVHKKSYVFRLIYTLNTFFFHCVVAEAAQSQCDMADELTRQLEDILSTYCRESMSDDTGILASGQSHSPEFNGLTRDGDKPEEGKVNGANRGGEKEQRKTHDKKKVKGLGKESFSL